jgi:hypothetical protein
MRIVVSFARLVGSADSSDDEFSSLRRDGRSLAGGKRVPPPETFPNNTIEVPRADTPLTGPRGHRTRISPVPDATHGAQHGPEGNAVADFESPKNQYFANCGDMKKAGLPPYTN